MWKLFAGFVAVVDAATAILWLWVIVDGSVFVPSTVSEPAPVGLIWFILVFLAANALVAARAIVLDMDVE